MGQESLLPRGFAAYALPVLLNRVSMLAETLNPIRTWAKIEVNSAETRGQILCFKKSCNSNSLVTLVV